ncbi:hypothetical protein GZL_01796 [Streptomyces sp. 769]|nr:hypothetical protein GZL_01796 [Streptomyces sp. 769]
MSTGAASRSAGNTPPALNTCHTTTSPTGPTARRTHRGTVHRRPDTGTTRDNATAPPGPTGTPAGTRPAAAACSPLINNPRHRRTRTHTPDQVAPRHTTVSAAAPRAAPRPVPKRPARTTENPADSASRSADHQRKERQQPRPRRQHAAEATRSRSM